MDPLDHLHAEHRAILRVLDVLDDALARARRGATPAPVALVSRGVDFLRDFADGSHHQKEHALFGALRAHRLPTGLLERVASEHKLTRDVAAEVRSAVGAVLAGRGQGEAALVETAERCTRLHRDHTQEEERIVFPLARRLLTPLALDGLRSQFARIEGLHGSLVDAGAAVERAFPNPATLAARRASTSPSGRGSG
jgi:hemerythrin-like domain-containing protein